MEEDEDDVFRKGLQHWPSSHRLKQTDRGLQTAGRLPNGMLPCRTHEERRRLLYGNAGLLLLAPPARSQPLDGTLQENLQPMDPPVPRLAQSVETLIGQKLQLIGDQFYQEHMMRQRNQRVQQPLWWRAVLAFHTLLFRREAGGRRDDRR